MIKPYPYTYDDFPASMAAPEGMKTMTGEPFAHGCSYTADVEYARRGDTPLTLQILVPSGMGRENKTWPLVVYVPGSAWHKQNIHVPVAMAGRLSDRGFAVAMVEYRPSDDAPFPAQVEDAKAAIRFLMQNAERFHIDPDKTVAFGDSSGGHTALLAAYTWGEDQLDMDTGHPAPCPLRGVVDYYAPIDISKMNDAPSCMDHLGPDSPEGYLIGRRDVREYPALVARTVVTNYIGGETPPTLIIHGDKDRTVPFEQSVLLYEALKAAGKDVDFYKLQGGDHAGPAFWTKEVLDLVEAFIHRVISHAI